MEPLLKWAGGKRTLVPTIKKFYSQESRLVEPFVGGLSVALGINPERALLNDVNPHVVNLYKQVQQGLVVSLTDYTNDSNTYYRNRNRFNQLIEEGIYNTPEAAELFYYLNRTGFNGLCRFNQKGFYNVPCGSYKTINYKTDFTEYKSVFANWDFTCGDFESIKLEDGDFVYADPPYDDTFTNYSQGGFSWNDQIRLAEWLSKHSGTVVISNNATDRILELYGDFGFTIEKIEMPRRISSNGDRTPAVEVLAWKHASMALLRLDALKPTTVLSSCGL